MTTQNTSPLAVSVADAMATLSLGRTKIFELIKKGDLRTFKIGRKTLIPTADLNALMERELAR